MHPVPQVPLRSTCGYSQFCPSGNERVRITKVDRKCPSGHVRKCKEYAQMLSYGNSEHFFQQKKAFKGTHM
jgi:hypothetical protein